MKPLEAEGNTKLHGNTDYLRQAMWKTLSGRLEYSFMQPSIIYPGTQYFIFGMMEEKNPLE